MTPAVPPPDPAARRGAALTFAVVWSVVLVLVALITRELAYVCFVPPPLSLLDVLLGGLRSRAPDGGDFAARGREVRAFADTHPGTRVVWAGYPSETMADGRHLADERAAFGIPAESLDLHGAWLPADLHWTPTGTEAVAAQLCP